jgi:hypothetical protein
MFCDVGQSSYRYSSQSTLMCTENKGLIFGDAKPIWTSTCRAPTGHLCMEVRR